MGHHDIALIGTGEATKTAPAKPFHFACAHCAWEFETLDGEYGHAALEQHLQNEHMAPNSKAVTKFVKISPKGV